MKKLLEIGVLAFSSPVAPEQATGAQMVGSLGSPPGMVAADVAQRADMAATLGGEQPKTLRTLPRFDPLSAGSSSGKDQARVKVRLARLQLESEEQARRGYRELSLQIRKLEIEAETTVRLKHAGCSEAGPEQGSNTGKPLHHSFSCV